MKKVLVSLIMVLLLFRPTALGETQSISSRFDQEAIPQTLTLAYKKDGVYQIQGMNRLIEPYRAAVPDPMKAKIRQWNQALDPLKGKIPTYSYFAESCRTHPLKASFPEVSPIYQYLRDHLHVDHSDHLKYSTFEQFCAYYYATDHHWNYRGSYQAYVDIVQMLLGDKEEVLKPSAIEVLPVVFNGSFAKKINEPLSQERFAFYRFDDAPEYTAYVDGKKKAYGGMKNYLNQKYSAKPFTNHYGALYGGNHGLLVLEKKDWDQKERRLLVIGDSFKKPVLPLLIQHYHQIIAVDLRYYRDQVGKDFSLSGVAKEYGVDQILLLDSLAHYISSDYKKVLP